MSRHVTTVALAMTIFGATGCGRPTVTQAKNTSEGALTQSLGLPGAANSTPVLSASGSWVVAVWTANEHERTNVYAATSSDSASHFGAPVRVNDLDGEAHVYGEDPPRVAMTAANGAAPPEILVTWPSDRARHLGMRSARSVDGGRTFLPSVSIGDEHVVGERGFQSVTIGADHVVRAAWLDQRRDPGTPPHKNVEGDWDPMHLMFASATAEGRWSPEVRLATNVCGCCKTAIASAADGHVYVAFRNIYPGSLRDISFAMSRDGGRTFAAPVRISEDHWVLDGCPDDGPTMAIDGSGVVYIVWPTLVQGPEPAIGLFHVSTRDGVTFTTRQRIETLGTVKPSHPQLTVDGCGAMTLVWDESQASRRRAVMRQLTPLPSGDVRPGDVRMLSGARSAVYPVVAPTADGVVVAWTDIAADDADHSGIGIRRVPLDATCEVPTEAAKAMSLSSVATGAPLSTKRYALKGLVVSVNPSAKTITVDHEAIPGFMGAMAMPYPVKDAKLLDGLSKGMPITATVVRSGDDVWLEDVAPNRK